MGLYIQVDFVDIRCLKLYIHPIPTGMAWPPFQMTLGPQNTRFE